jgi:glycerol-3-phosphate O-acyltransferase
MSRAQNLFSTPQATFGELKKMNYLPPYKQLIKQFLSDPEFKNLAKEAQEKKRLRKYLAEMLPRVGVKTLWFVQWLIMFLFRIIFTRLIALDTDVLKSLPALNKKYSIVFVANHRSNADYLFLGVTLLKFHVDNGHTVANLKINIFPFGYLFQKAGAFFVRQGERDFLYRELLTRFAHFLKRRRRNLVIFPEGGLSPDGKWRSLKTGFLTSFLSKHPEPVALVPVCMAYDRVPEDRNLVKKNNHHPEHMRYFWNKFKMFAFLQSYRSAYIRFEKPILIEEPITKAQTKEKLEQIFNQFSQNPILTPMMLISQYLIENQNTAIDLSLLKKHFESQLKKYTAFIHFGRSSYAWLEKELFVRNILQKAPSGQVVLNPNEITLLKYYVNQGHFEVSYTI